MTRRTRTHHAWACTIAIAGTLAGLSGADAQTVQCRGNACDVLVTMTGDPAATTVTVSANELRMEKGARNPVITWKLAAANYEFRQDSIRPHTGAATPAKPTTSQAAWDDQCTRLSTTATAIRIRNLNTRAGPLAYDVKVYHKTNGLSFTLDPVIFNDP